MHLSLPLLTLLLAPLTTALKKNCHAYEVKVTQCRWTNTPNVDNSMEQRILYDGGMLENPLTGGSKCLGGSGVTLIQDSKDVGNALCTEEEKADGKTGFEYVYRINRWRSEWDVCNNVQWYMEEYARLDGNVLNWVYAVGDHVKCIV